MGIIKEKILGNKIIYSISEQYNRKNISNCDEKFFLPYLYDTFWIRTPKGSYTPSVGDSVEVLAHFYDCNDLSLGAPMRFYHDGSSLIQSNFLINLINSTTLDYDSIALYGFYTPVFDFLVTHQKNECCFYIKFEYYINGILQQTAFTQQMQLVTDDNISNFVTFETPKYGQYGIDCLGRGYYQQDNVTVMVLPSPAIINEWSNRITLPCTFSISGFSETAETYGSSAILRKNKTKTKITYYTEYMPQFVINEMQAILDYLPQDITVYYGKRDMSEFDVLQRKEEENWAKIDTEYCGCNPLIELGLYNECVNNAC